MNQELLNFAARLRFAAARQVRDDEFNELALELFVLQLRYNPAYRKICAGRKLMPGAIEHWTEIPPVPTAVFKELELTSIPPAERTAVFHSSGTTEQKPSKHHHCPASLALYETSLWAWFRENVLPDLRFTIHDLRADEKSAIGPAMREQSAIFLTPPPAQAPHSSLVHMFETIRQKLGGASVPASRTDFFGKITSDGGWTLDFDAVVDVLSSVCSDFRSSRGNEAQTGSEKREVRASSRRLLHVPRAANPVLVLGTAFSFVHLLDHLVENDLRFQLPAGSRVMETGGYKNRSRSLPKAELHQLITERLGVPPENILCEYGMSELSSQAYDLGALASRRRIVSNATQELAGGTPALPGNDTRHFHFPPWARVQIISPETGREVAEGETGLIRILDLANVFSVMAVQTEDLGIRRGDGFELIGRAALAEARGCSLMTVGEPIL